MIEAKDGLIGQEAALDVDGIVCFFRHAKVAAEGTRVQSIAQHVEDFALRKDHQELVQALEECLVVL